MPTRTLPPRHTNDLSSERKDRSSRKIVAGVAPNTPNRKCLQQSVVDDNGVQHVRYYHVTKGWRVRKIIEPGFGSFLSTIRRANQGREV